MSEISLRHICHCRTHRKNMTLSTLSPFSRVLRQVRYWLSGTCVAFVQLSHWRDVMSVKSYTYICFSGTAKDACEYYLSIFGGELEMLTYGQFPVEIASEFPFDLNP